MNMKNILHKRPIVLSIAGFDPSGGAGLLADVKTFESLKTYGIAVQTALTVQTDTVFQTCHWTAQKQIVAQLDLLLEHYPIQAIKIGIVENRRLLLQLLQKLREYSSTIPIVWDPVLKATTGFSFQLQNDELLEECLKNITVLTPNWQEMVALFGNDFSLKINEITQHCAVYLKGGHREVHIGEDILYKKSGKIAKLRPKIKNCREKHGSGCVLASALAAYLTLGFPLQKAALRAKRYTERFLQSNSSQLGYYKL